MVRTFRVMVANNNTEGLNFEFTYSNLPFVIICVIGVASNVLLLIAFSKDPLKCFRNSGTYLVMNLSVADCLTCIFAPFIHAMPKTSWYPVVEYFTLWSTFASLASILSVSIDRFILVAFPIRHRIWVKAKVIVMWLAAVWTMSCALPILRLFYGPGRNFEIYKYAFCQTIIIPSVFFYAFTYYKLKKQSRNIASQNSNEGWAQEQRVLKEKQFLKTIILIACIAFACTMPSLVFFQVYGSLTSGQDNLEKTFQKVFMCIFVINFAVNPFIYVVRLPNYRKTFRILYYERGSQY